MPNIAVALFEDEFFLSVSVACRTIPSYGNVDALVIDKNHHMVDTLRTYLPIVTHNTHMGWKYTCWGRRRRLWKGSCTLQDVYK